MSTVSTEIAQPKPDYDLILAHLQAHFGDAMSGRIEIAWRDGRTGALNKAETFDVGDLFGAAECAAKVNAVPGQNVYFGAALRDDDVMPVGRCSDEDVIAAEWLWVDLDDAGAAEAARDKVKTLALPSYTVVTGRHPHIRVQMWWRVEEPITDHDELCRTLSTICDHLGGDPTVVNPGRVMRLAGSVAWPAKEGRVVEMTEYRMRSAQAYDITQIHRMFGGVVENTPQDQHQPAGQYPRVSSGSLGLRTIVPEGHRDAYRRDVILACFVEFVGETGTTPTEAELFEAAHPVIEKGIGQPDAPPEIRKTHFKIKYLLNRFVQGRLPGLPTLDAVVDSYRVRQREKAAQRTQEPQRVVEEVKRAEGIRLESIGEFLSGFTPPDYLLDRVLQRRYLYSFTAPTGHGKTAVSVEIALCAVQGLKIGPHDCQQGNVVYLCGENPDDVRARLLTIAKVRSLDVTNMPLYLVDGRFDIGLAHQRLKDELERIGGAVLVIVDTLMAYFTGDDDNSNAQMAAYARDVLRPITKMPGGPCVLVPSHPVKNPSKDNLTPRGGGAFLNEVDGNLTLWADGEGTTEMHWAGKIRGPSFNAMSFVLEEIQHPAVTDSKGRTMTSIMARAVTDAEAETRLVATRSEEDELLDIMLNLPSAGIRGWAEQLGWTSTMGVPLKNKVSRLLKRLHDDKLVTKQRGAWRLTDAGKSEVKTNVGTYKAKPSWRDQERF